LKWDLNMPNILSSVSSQHFLLIYITPIDYLFKTFYQIEDSLEFLRWGNARVVSEYVVEAHLEPDRILWAFPALFRNYGQVVFSVVWGHKFKYDLLYSIGWYVTTYFNFFFIFECGTCLTMNYKSIDQAISYRYFKMVDIYCLFLRLWLRPTTFILFLLLFFCPISLILLVKLVCNLRWQIQLV